MKIIILLPLLLCVACGKSGGGSVQAPSLCPEVKGAVCTQEDGFIDMSLCSTDLHLQNNQIYLSGSSEASTTSNDNYVVASNGLYQFPQGGPHGPECAFVVNNGTVTPGTVSMGVANYEK